jgi:hypothetical protein
MFPLRWCNRGLYAFDGDHAGWPARRETAHSGMLPTPIRPYYALSRVVVRSKIDADATNRAAAATGIHRHAARFKYESLPPAQNTDPQVAMVPAPYCVRHFVPWNRQCRAVRRRGRASAQFIAMARAGQRTLAPKHESGATGTT